MTRPSCWWRISRRGFCRRSARRCLELRLHPLDPAGHGHVPARSGASTMTRRNWRRCRAARSVRRCGWPVRTALRFMPASSGFLPNIRALTPRRRRFGRNGRGPRRRRWRPLRPDDHASGSFPDPRRAHRPDGRPQPEAAEGEAATLTRISPIRDRRRLWASAGRAGTRPRRPGGQPDPAALVLDMLIGLANQPAT